MKKTTILAMVLLMALCAPGFSEGEYTVPGHVNLIEGVPAMPEVPEYTLTVEDGAAILTFAPGVITGFTLRSEETHGTAFADDEDGDGVIALDIPGGDTLDGVTVLMSFESDGNPAEYSFLDGVTHLFTSFGDETVFTSFYWTDGCLETYTQDLFPPEGDGFSLSCVYRPDGTLDSYNYVSDRAIVRYDAENQLISFHRNVEGGAYLYSAETGEWSFVERGIGAGGSVTALDGAPEGVDLADYPPLTIVFEEEQDG